MGNTCSNCKQACTDTEAKEDAAGDCYESSKCCHTARCLQLYCQGEADPEIDLLENSACTSRCSAL